MKSEDPKACQLGWCLDRDSKWSPNACQVRRAVS